LKQEKDTINLFIRRNKTDTRIIWPSKKEGFFYDLEKKKTTEFLRWFLGLDGGPSRILDELFFKDSLTFGLICHHFLGEKSIKDNK
jgi:hypothetical protein